MQKSVLSYFLDFKIKGISFIQLLFFYFLFSFIIPDFVQAEESHVGEIRHSILTRAQFRELYGEEWDLMQGQAIEADSELLQLWGKGHVPDARGLFLRCSNSDRSGEDGSPHGNIEVGNYQKDQLKSHAHSSPYFATAFYQPCDRGMGPNFAIAIFQHGPYNSSCPSSNSGGLETRPRCISVNAFIKMKESAPGGAAQSTQAMTPEAMREMIRRPEIRGEIETIFRELIRGNH